MFETARKAMYIGMGAAAMSWDRMKEMIDDMVSQGDITADEGKRLYTEFTSKAEEHGKHASDRMRSQMREMLTDMGVAEQSYVASLERRIDALEMRLSHLETETMKKESDAA